MSAEAVLSGKTLPARDFCDVVENWSNGVTEYWMLLLHSMLHHSKR
jgi:hypothetical protein